MRAIACVLHSCQKQQQQLKPRRIHDDRVQKSFAPGHGYSGVIDVVDVVVVVVVAIMN